ncbi:hypothetical protein PHJA_002335700 [Phtheirospermum japonicum]|uniref:Uncharacterized protein n=1 Tax=Phtheirospermum japonicum TaxID=374723 RepID=A0A830CMQ6_9LAMI|nr:hypothetical protein PHJA_002335700 [Phtheirospermum japonicum]
MGICSSCDSTSVATAKLILDDGKLLEYSYPVKVSYVLQKNIPASFICNADEMDFYGVVSALGDDEVLHPGHLYFALPLVRMGRRMRPEEMAALAVRASSALRDHTLVFSGENVARPSTREAAAGGDVGRRRRGKFKARLSGIPE